LYPCDVVFVHRDAEKERPERRNVEIQDAVNVAFSTGFKHVVVAVIPIRMSEAWLLFDENAIRHAARNPRGTANLNLPPLERVESRPDPKKDLWDALQSASELRGRRLKKFSSSSACRNVVDHVRDFGPLRRLPGFRAFESTVSRMSQSQWRHGFYGLDQT